MILQVTHIHSQEKETFQGNSGQLAQKLLEAYPHLDVAYPELELMIRKLRKGDFHVVLMDDSGEEVKLELNKGEDLSKMAIKDLPMGKEVGKVQTYYRDKRRPLNNNTIQYDYSHLLPEAYRNQGYGLWVHDDGTNIDSYVSPPISLIPEDSFGVERGELIGQVQGGLGIDGYGQPLLNVDYSKIHSDHRGKGLGNAIYEALYSHAYHKLGARSVQGGYHSSMASPVHQSISRRHGLDYKPVVQHGKDPSKRGEFDASYRPYDYTLKSEDGWDATEDLLFKAVKDIPPGEETEAPKLQGLFMGKTKYQWYDFNHLLTPDEQKKYRLYVRHAVDKTNDCHLLYATLLKRQGTTNEMVGNIFADSNTKTPRYLSVSFAEVEPAHRGNGFGRRMYEALYSHALNTMGINKVKGGLHSTMAYKAHQALAAKHGLKYEPKLNDEGNKPTSFKPKSKGAFDHRYKSYSYYLDKSEETVANLLKANEEDEVLRLLNNPDPIESELALKLDSVTPSHLAHAVTHPNASLAMKALKHPKVDQDVLMSLFTAPRNTEVQLAGLKHPEINPGHLLALYNLLKAYPDADQEVLKAALTKHPKLTPELIEEFWPEGVLSQRGLLAHHNAPETVVNQPIAEFLLDDKDKRLAPLAYLAMQSPKADPELLHQAVLHGNFETKEFATKNPNIEARTISLLLTEGLIPKQDDSEVNARLNCLDAHALTPAHIGLAIKDCSPQVRSKAILHPLVEPEHLEQIIAGNNPVDILVALKSPALTKELAEKAANHKDKSVAMAAKVRHKALFHTDFEKSLGEFLGQPLAKMAIKDIPPGQAYSEDTVDYSHLLPEEFQDIGMKLHVRHLPEIPGVADSKLAANIFVERKGLKPEQVGSLAGNLIGHNLQVFSASVRPSFPRGKGLGTAMYEAMYHHAVTHHGVTRAIGSNHSTSAHFTHQKLAQKHGWKYKAKQTDPSDRFEYGIPGYDEDPTAFDDKYGGYSYALKSEGDLAIPDGWEMVFGVDLEKMAIKDIPRGGDNILLNGEKYTDYTHLLPEEFRQTHHLGVKTDNKGGLSTSLRENKPVEEYPEEMGYVEGDLYGTTDGKDQKHIRIGLSKLSPILRRRGIGTAMYEAAFRHAYDLGARHVVGGYHSSNAHALHQKLSEKHGWDYNGKTHNEYIPMQDEESERTGAFDGKYGGYEYALKSEDALNKAHPGPSFPNLGFDLRRETPIVEANSLAHKSKASTIAAATADATIKAYSFSKPWLASERPEIKDRNIDFNTKRVSGAAGIGPKTTSFALSSESKKKQNPYSVSGPKSDLATQGHEDLHLLFNRIEQKHGEPARYHLAENIMRSLPKEEYDAVTNIGRLAGYNEQSRGFDEEALASMINYMNDPEYRQAIHSRGKEDASGEFTWIGNTPSHSFHDYVKRAHRYVLAAADVAHKGWMDKLEPWRVRKDEEYQSLESFWGLEKMAVNPKDLKPIQKVFDSNGPTLVDHSIHLDGHPPEHSHLVETYKNMVVDNPHVIKRTPHNLSGISKKVIFEVGALPLFGIQNSKFMVKPYHEKFGHRTFDTWMKHPHQGWAEMTNQALYHAAGIGHLHQKVFTVEHDFGGGKKEPALVVHMEPGKNQFGMDQEFGDSCFKIKLMDFLTNNNDRHRENFLTRNNQPIAIDHSRSFQYFRNPNNKWEKASRVRFNTDSIDNYGRTFIDMLPRDEEEARNYLQTQVDWYAANADKVEETLKQHLKAIKDPEVAKHIWRNFKTRSNHIKQMSEFGVENFGRYPREILGTEVNFWKPGEESPYDR